MKDLLTKMWEDADTQTRKHYEKKEQDDRERYVDLKDINNWMYDLFLDTSES